MTKTHKTRVDHGTGKLEIGSAKDPNQFIVYLKTEQWREHKGEFMVTIYKAKGDKRRKAGDIRISFKPTFTDISLFGCKDFRYMHKEMISDTALQECKRIYDITSMSMQEFLMAL